MISLDSPIFQAFLEFFDVLSKYNSFRSIDDKRNHYDEILTAFSQFINTYYSNGNDSLPYNKFFALDKSFNAYSQVVSWYEDNSYPKKYKYFCENLFPEYNLNKLLHWYKGLKDFPPDNMEEIDDSLFSTCLHFLIDIPTDFTNHSYISQDSSVYHYITNVSDFFTWLYVFIIQIHMDDWNISQAYILLNEFYSRQLDKTKYYKSSLDSSVMLPLFTQLSSRLYLCKDSKGAKYCYQMSKKCLPFIKRKGYNLKYFQDKVEDCSKILNNVLKYRIVIKHLRQLNNLKKYAIIDESTYEKNLKKLQSKDKKELEKQNLLQQYLLQHGFITNLKYENLSSAEKSEIESLKTKITAFIQKKLDEKNATSSTDGWVVTSTFSFSVNTYDYLYFREDMHTAYNTAFYINPTLLNIQKFTLHRLTSILRSLVLCNQTELIDKMINEVQVLMDISRKNLNEYYCSSILTEFLKQCKTDNDNSLLEKKLYLLKHSSNFYYIPEFNIKLLLQTTDELEDIAKAQTFVTPDSRFCYPKQFNQLTSKDVLDILKTDNGLTQYGNQHIDEIASLLNDYLIQYKQEHGNNCFTAYIEQFSNMKALTENEYSILKQNISEKDFNFWKKIHETRSDNDNQWIDDGNLPTIMEVALSNLAKSKLRELENTIRVNHGIPKIGEGWVSETALYQSIKSSFPNENIEFHGRPACLGQQHLDIYFPSHKIAIEYQGLQHQKPVQFFGGEDSYKLQVERDEKKRKICSENGITLLYCYEDSDFENIYEQLNKLLNSLVN